MAVSPTASSAVLAGLRHARDGLLHLEQGRGGTEVAGQQRAGSRLAQRGGRAVEGAAAAGGARIFQLRVSWSAEQQ